ncbi:MAG: START domain-containing protein [Agitococcus sp.]|nr:START domain-containing protein [Agitococcus sp.]MDO9178316.1 START domain-containing protein [Agitococcus sp.]
MLKKLSAILLSVFVLGAVPLVAQADLDDDLDDLRGTNPFKDWRLIKNDTRRSIKAYDKRSDETTGVRSFKLDVVVDGSLETVSRVYFDVDNYTRWFWTVRESKILKKVSDTEFYYYLQHDAPVTLPDRDVIIHAIIEPYTELKGYAAFKLKAVPNFIPPKPPLVRMLAEDMLIRWTPIGVDKTRLEVEGFIHPGGDVPAWAINAVQRQAPYYTMLGLQRMVQMTQYKSPTTPMPFTIRKE